MLGYSTFNFRNPLIGVHVPVSTFGKLWAEGAIPV